MSKPTIFLSILLLLAVLAAAAMGVLWRGTEGLLADARTELAQQAARKDAVIRDREDRIEGLRASLDHVYENARNPAYYGILRTLASLPALCKEFDNSPVVPAVCAEFATRDWADQVRKDGLTSNPLTLLHRLQLMVAEACVPLRKSGREWPQMPKVCSGES